MFSNPHHNIEQFGLEHGQKVADFGAGSGAYAVALAQVVTGAGKVFALDIQKDLLSKLKAMLSQSHITNVETIWADLEKLGGSHLSNEAVDAVVAANVLNQVVGKKDFISEIKRVLKSQGRVLLVDWSDSFSGMGPSAGAVVNKIVARGLFEAVGFAFEREIQAGEHHYGLIFKKV